jgi:hypothetical protein
MKISEFQQLLANSSFSNIFNCRKIKIAQLNLFISLLIEANMPFELVFSEQTTASRASVIIEIPLTPVTAVTLNLEIC